MVFVLAEGGNSQHASRVFFLVEQGKKGKKKKEEQTQNMKPIWWVENPITKKPAVSPGDILVMKNSTIPLFSHVSLAVSGVSTHSAVWLEFFPEYPYCVLLLDDLKKWVQQFPEDPDDDKKDLTIGLPLERFDVFLPLEVLRKLATSGWWFWKIGIELTGPRQNSVTIVEQRSDKFKARMGNRITPGFFQGLVWFIHVINCVEGPCGEEKHLLQDEPTDIIQWQGSPEIAKSAVKMAQQWTKQEAKVSSSSFSKKMKTQMVGQCFPAVVPSLSDYFNKPLMRTMMPGPNEIFSHKEIFEHLKLKDIFKLLQTKVLSSEFIILAWQLALISRGQSLHALPMNAAACTSNDLLKLAKEAPTFWRLIPLGPRPRSGPEHKSIPERPLSPKRPRTGGEHQRKRKERNTKKSRSCWFPGVLAPGQPSLSDRADILLRSVAR